MIKVMRTGLFNEVEVEDGIMSLSLATIATVGRGAR